ncbi:MAG: FecR domain-containing protein, partial [Candidatus Gracilibacteria bacterium]
MMQSKKAFSLVEIIITVSIIALLAVIGISSKQGYNENMSNTKVVADVETIKNALTSFSEETKTLPMPGGNTNFYSVDTSYKHSYDDSDTFGVYGSITEDTIAKKYINVLPIDPRTNSYYSYGKTKTTNEFEIASIQVIDTLPVSKVVGNYTATEGPFNLIRGYNGPNFVNNNSNVNFPYNPDELILVATDIDGNIFREGDTILTGTGEQMEIFFSDGSVSIIEENSEIELTSLDFKGTDNLNTIVKIGLTAGKIWTRATKLNDQSSFEVYTTDTTAAVRGTIFGV